MRQALWRKAKKPLAQVLGLRGPVPNGVVAVDRGTATLLSGLPLGRSCEDAGCGMP